MGPMLYIKQLQMQYSRPFSTLVALTVTTVVILCFHRFRLDCSAFRCCPKQGLPLHLPPVIADTSIAISTLSILLKRF